MKKYQFLLLPSLLSGCAGYEHYRAKPKSGPEKTIVTKQKNESGLQYEILQTGTGPAVHAGQSVAVHYTGWLDQNGEPSSKFDSSLDRGLPFNFQLGAGRVIRGWDEGVAGMQIGEKRRLWIPADLGYGARGAGGLIPPHANLIFDVELLGVD